MQSQFEPNGRVEVRSDAPEALQRVARAIRERLENDGAIVPEASADGFSFHGESVSDRHARPRFGSRRWRNSRFVGLIAGEVRFSSAGDRIGIEYRIAFNDWPSSSTAVHAAVLAVAVTLFATLPKFGGILLLLPIGLLATWIAPRRRIRDFDWNIQRTAMRGLIEGAARELETRQAVAISAHAC